MPSPAKAASPWIRSASPRSPLAVAGQLATRRTTQGQVWRTLGEVRLRCEDAAVWAEGGHVETLTRLNDEVELVAADPSCFLLHGRHADLVNIAGKRTSLGYLNHQLNAIAGVRDGVFLLPDNSDDATAEGVRRLSALVVAPDLTPAALMQALRERIDAIFLPRPLLFVDALPRNATGKLAGQVAQAMLAEPFLQVEPHRHRHFSRCRRCRRARGRCRGWPPHRR